MRDYKRIIGKKFKILEKDINRSFKEFRKIQLRPKPFSFLSSFIKIKKNAVIIGAAVIVLLTMAVLFASQFRGPAGSRISYIGELKLKQEMESMENAEAVGGSEIKNFDTNSSELRFFFYKIKHGESIYTLSKKLGVSMDTLISLNSMENAHVISEGKRIIVPNLQGILYSVKKNDSLEGIAKKYKISVDDILDANDLSDTELASTIIYEGEMLFLPGAQMTDAERAKALGYLFLKPIHGRFTSGFGIRTDPFTGLAGYHPGIDISAPYGSSVVSAKEGRVVFKGWHGGYGKCIIIRHQFGYETVYGHLSSIGVKKDAWVKAGQYLGRVGSTGRSTGPHLHFEVRKYGRPLNPLRQAGLGKRKGRWY